MSAEGKCLNFKKELYFFSKLKTDLGKKSKHPVVKENQPMKIVLGVDEWDCYLFRDDGRVFGKECCSLKWPFNQSLTITMENIKNLEPESWRTLSTTTICCGRNWAYVWTVCSPAREQSGRPLVLLTAPGQKEEQQREEICSLDTSENTQSLVADIKGTKASP